MFFKIKKKNLKKSQPILMYVDSSSWTVVILIYCLSSSPVLPHIFIINACRRWAACYPSSAPGPLSQVWVNKYWAKITKPDACKELRWMKRVNLLCFIFVYYTQRPIIHLIRHYVNSTFFLLKYTPVWLPIFSPHLREVWTQNNCDDKQQLSGEAPSGPQSPHVKKKKKKKKTVICSSQVVPCGVAGLVFQLP